MIQHNWVLLKTLPRVLRARDYHLYLENGKRLTDLWLCGGKAILGHKPPLVLKELKNAAERGLFSPLPHPLEGRFLKALGALFPNRAFRLYSNEASLYEALERAALERAALSENAPFWRPFLDAEEEAAIVKAPLFIPVLPCPLGPEALVLDKSAEASFPQSELISPVLLAAATRSLYNLAAEIKAGKRERFVKIGKALLNSAWKRRGIYLTIDIETTQYEALFRRFLEGGFLLPPSLLEPAILPPFMSPGEEAKLADLLGDKAF